jgi:hypothetical protein
MIRWMLDILSALGEAATNREHKELRIIWI